MQIDIKFLQQTEGKKTKSNDKLSSTQLALLQPSGSRESGPLFCARKFSALLAYRRRCWRWKHPDKDEGGRLQLLQSVVVVVIVGVWLDRAPSIIILFYLFYCSLAVLWPYAVVVSSPRSFRWMGGFQINMFIESYFIVVFNVICEDEFRSKWKVRKCQHKKITVKKLTTKDGIEKTSENKIMTSHYHSWWMCQSTDFFRLIQDASLLKQNARYVLDLCRFSPQMRLKSFVPL